MCAYIFFCFKISSLISNMTNVDRYNHIRRALWENSVIFKSVKRIGQTKSSANSCWAEDVDSSDFAVINIQCMRTMLQKNILL